jgi:hypothetical protein
MPRVIMPRLFQRNFFARPAPNPQVNDETQKRSGETQNKYRCSVHNDLTYLFRRAKTRDVKKFNKGRRLEIYQPLGTVRFRLA